MQITLTTPMHMQVAEIKVALELPQEMILPLFIGHLFMGGDMPDEIGEAMDKLPEESIPAGWRMVAEMWRNRGDKAEVLDLIRHMTQAV